MSNDFRNRKSEVLEKIAEQYGVSPEQATHLVGYHREVRSHLNSLFCAAATGDKLETRESNSVKTTSFFGRIIGIFFPPAGAAIESVADVANAIRSRFDEKTLKNAQELLNACGGLDNLNKLTKTLATQLVEQYTQNLISIGYSKIKARAKHDAQAIEKSIGNGNFKDLIDEGYYDEASLSGNENLEFESTAAIIKKTQERMKKAVLDQHPILQDHSNHETLGAHTDKFNNHHQTQTHSLN